MWAKLFEFASRITNKWALAAYGIAAIVYLVSKTIVGRGRKVPPFVWVAIVLLVLIPFLAATYEEIVYNWGVTHSVYRLRVTILDIQHQPTEDAILHCSAGGEPKKVLGGWEFDIPKTTVPADGKLSVFASIPSAFLSGRADLTLSTDYNVSITIQLEPDTSSWIRGIVVDDHNVGLEGALVSLVGHGPETVRTSQGGHFGLPAYAADGQEVQLHVEKQGYTSVSQYHPAGKEPVTIVLYKVR
jgi:hypothetical protein